MVYILLIFICALVGRLVWLVGEGEGGDEGRSCFVLLWFVVFVVPAGYVVSITSVRSADLPSSWFLHYFSIHLLNRLLDPSAASPVLCSAHDPLRGSQTTERFPMGGSNE